MPAIGGNGLAMRTSMFSHAAEQVGDVLIIVVAPDSGTVAENQLFRPDTSVVRIHGGFDTRLSLIARAMPIGSRPGLLVEYGKPLASIALSAATITGIIGHLAAFQPDAIVLSRAYMLPIVDALEGELAQVPLLVDLDDDDSALCRSLAGHERETRNDDEALWLMAQADVCDAIILRHAGRVGHFTAASESVIGAIQKRLGISNISCVANGVSPVASAPVRTVDVHGQATPGTHLRPALIFVGNLSYKPNRDGLLWFLGDVWPGLRDVVPGVSFMVAGSNPDQQLRRLCQQGGVELIVNPQDLTPLYRLADAAIVPLRFGSGSRIKILEAGTHGVPVISTFAGAEGLNLQPDAHAFLSDETADAFVSSCLACLRNRDEAHRRSMLLQAFIEERHDRQKIVNKLHKTLRGFVAG
jgi:glycosyltransferase involved in cell wall biosynthesis